MGFNSGFKGLINTRGMTHLKKAFYKHTILVSSPTFDKFKM